MCSGLGKPFGRVGGASSRGRSSRIERTAEIAVRSAARWTLPLPVSAPAIETNASAAIRRTAAAPSTAGSACPAWVTAIDTGRRPSGRQRPERPCGDPDQQPTAAQVADRQRGERTVARKLGAEQRAAGADPGMLERRLPEPRRKVKDAGRPGGDRGERLGGGV